MASPVPDRTLPVHFLTSFTHRHLYRMFGSRSSTIRTTSLFSRIHWVWDRDSGTLPTVFTTYTPKSITEITRSILTAFYSSSLSPSRSLQRMGSSGSFVIRLG